MKKFSAFTFLILLYLGLSKSLIQIQLQNMDLDPATDYLLRDIVYIKNRNMLEYEFKGAPISLILIDSYSTGLIFKTFYHKYRVIDFSEQPKDVIVRTSLEFSRDHEDFIGMAIFQREEKTNKAYTTPLPPGYIFIGKEKYGHWINIKHDRIWRFYPHYAHYPEHLGWKKFIPNYTFFQKSQIHLAKDIPFFGTGNEFGTAGKITREAFPEHFLKLKMRKKNFAEHFKSLLNLLFNWKLNE